MRILMLVPQLFYSARGTPLSAYHRARDLQALGHEVEILTYGVGDPPPDAGGRPLRVHRARGPHFARSVKQGPSRLKIWFDLLLMIALVVRLWRARYDALYAHEEGGFMGALVAPLFRIPLVYDMHSSLPLQIRDWGFSEREWVISIFRFVERFTLRRARVVVSIAPGVTAAAQAAWPSASVVTIPNRFDVGKPADREAVVRVREELGLRPEHRVVLYTGSFVKLQALDLLVRAVPAIAARVPEARVVLVGGHAGEIAELEALARELGTRSHLILVGQRAQEEMPAFVGAAEVLVSPRVQGINPPGKLASYMASGRPLVAVDRPIHTQMIDGACAVLVEPEPAALADGIVGLLLDPARARAIADAARQRARELWGDAEREHAYNELLRRLEQAPA